MRVCRSPAGDCDGAAEKAARWCLTLTPAVGVSGICAVVSAFVTFLRSDLGLWLCLVPCYFQNAFARAALLVLVFHGDGLLVSTKLSVGILIICIWPLCTLRTVVLGK